MSEDKWVWTEYGLCRWSAIVAIEGEVVDGVRYLRALLVDGSWRRLDFDTDEPPVMYQVVEWHGGVISE